MAVSRLLLDGNKAAADGGPDGGGCGLAKFPGSSILSSGIRPLDSTNPGVEWLLPKAAKIEKETGITFLCFIDLRMK